MTRERISSSTVLLLAFTAKNLRYFYVRRNAIILKCDWKQKEVLLTNWTKDIGYVRLIDSFQIRFGLMSFIRGWRKVVAPTKM